MIVAIYHWGDWVCGDREVLSHARYPGETVITGIPYESGRSKVFRRAINRHLLGIGIR